MELDLEETTNGMLMLNSITINGRKQSKMNPNEWRRVKRGNHMDIDDGNREIQESNYDNSQVFSNNSVWRIGDN